MSHPLTLILPYYDNAQMFREQQKVWRGISGKLRPSIHVIVVDDCSPTEPAVNHVHPETAEALASFRLFRSDEDVRWNWLFCRNLGVEKATTEWVVMTDMDHVIPEKTWGPLMKWKLNPLNAYRLSRVDAPDMTPVAHHPNTWIMTRHMFLNRIGGYDERFSGIYGSDGEFASRVELWARHIELLPLVAIRYHEAQIPDASTTRYERKTPLDREKRAEIKDEIARLKLAGEDFRPLRLQQQWAQVYP